MVEVGIPVYKARATIRDTLDSLVAQTRKRFLVCLSIDGDDDSYTDLVEEYTKRGLNIRSIWGENGGPGMARQRILDTTQCDYIMFVDADDMLMPQAVENLYSTAKLHNFDILRSSFVREEIDKDDLLLKHDIDVITWFHGKIYKVSYLKNNNIKFLPGLRVDEDAYFNLVAWNCTENRGSIDQVTYYWRYNKNSITRINNAQQYFSDTYIGYVRSQIEGLKEIYRIKKDISDILISYTLINIYEYYMQAKFYKLDLQVLDDLAAPIKEEKWLQEYFKKGQNWIDIANKLKQAKNINNQYIIFYEETFVKWSRRILGYGKQSESSSS